MSVKVPSNRLINFSSKPIFLGFYQQLLGRLSSFQELGSKLVREAESAQAKRQIDKVEEIGLILSNLPLKEYRLIGQYYLGWCAYRKGADVQATFERVLEISQTYKTKALWSLAAIASDRGSYETELKYLTSSLRFASGLATQIELAKGIAVVKAKEGYHDHALKDLESLIPILRFAKPHTRYDCLNSLAVELGEAGRIEEAQNVCRIVLASPFAFAYPEWRETANEIALRGYKSRSVVLVPELPLKVKDNVVPMPVNNNPILLQEECAKVLDLQARREQMVKEQNDEPNDENIDDMDRKDLLVKLLELTTVEDIDEEKLRKVVKYTVEVMTKK